MAISDFLKLNEENKENLRTTAKLTAAGGLTYYGLTQTSLREKLSENLSQDNLTRRGNELGDVGAEIRSQLDQVKNLLEGSKSKVLENFKNEIFNDSKLDDILNKEMSEEGVQEVRAFIDSVFDNVKYQNVPEDEEIERLLKNIYENPENINENQKDILKNFYKNRIEQDRKLLERFRGKYNQNLRIKNLLSNAVEEASPSMNKINMQQVNFNELNQIFDKGVVNKISERFNRIRSLAGSQVDFQLVGFDEFESGVKSIYARARINNRYFNLPLHLARDKNGLIYFRATENLSTRYASPLGIIDTQTLFSTGSSSAIVGDPKEALKKSFLDFEDHLINIAEQRFAGRQSEFQNLTKREMNSFLEYQRALATDVPRGMVRGASNLDQRFINNLEISRLVQSNILKLVGLESMPKKERGRVVENLIRRFPDMFGATIGAQTAEARLDDPFGGLSPKIVQSIEMRQDRDVFTGAAKSKPSVTPFNLLKKYNKLDRSVQPLVAREQQMHGRYEMAIGFENMREVSFGKSNIPVFGTGGQLLGVDPVVGKNYSTVNMAAIMAFEGTDTATRLGLAEGMSYSGSRIIVKSGQSKTVVQEGLSSTPLLRKLLNEKKLSFQGKDQLEEFFRLYGDKEGMAVLGTLDGRLTGVKNYEGLLGVNLSISEASVETGRNRYHINVELDRAVGGSKFFGPIIKDTVLETNQNGMIKKLEYLDKAMNHGGGEYSSLGTRLFGEYGGAAENTLLTTTATTSKSPQYLKMQVEGGLKIVGDFSNGMNFTSTSDEELLSLINSRRSVNDQISSLEQATRRELAGANLGDFIRQASKMSAEINLSGREFGSVMSYAYELATQEDKKFGMTRGFFEQMVREGAGTKADEYLTEAEKFRAMQVVIGGSSVTVGTPRSDLARNLAKIEPRVANYLYTSLRSNFGFNQAEATDYVAGLVNRQLGSETKMEALMGMKMISESLMKADPNMLEKQLTDMGADKLTIGQMEEFLGFGQGQEREVKEFLSQFEKGAVLDLDDLKLSNTMRKTIVDNLGGRSKIYLPGASTLDSLAGHEIRSAGKSLNIESELVRYITDLSGSISSMQTAGEDEGAIDRAMQGFKTSKANIAGVVGASLRGALSARILGSGTYSGAGIRFGKEEGAETILEGERVQGEGMPRHIRNKMLQAFDENKGYVAFMDASAFLDGMGKYKEAVEKDLIRTTGSTDVNKEVNKVMVESLQDFFLGMHRKKGLRGVSAAAQRNPFISFGHMMPAMSIFRYDFLKEGDEFFKMFKTSDFGGLEMEPAFERIQQFSDPDKNISTFNQFAGAVRKIEALPEGKQKAELQKDVRSLFSRMIPKHKERGVVGGGAVYFPEINIKTGLIDASGKTIGDYEGRMDFTRFAIGDYDADIYQIFFDTDKKMRNAIIKGEKHKGLIEYGSKFLISMSELGKGMKNLGQRIEGVTGEMNLLESRIDDATKEKYVKAVGNLDVYVKTGMLGLAQAAASDASGDMGKSFSRMSAGAALVSVAQEVLAIKAKKLPIAAGISDQFVEALRASFESGSGERIKEFFRTKVLPGTAFAEGGSIKIDPKTLEFTDLPEGAGMRTFKSALTGMEINIDELFESLDVMSRTVKETGIGTLTSDTRVKNLLSSGRFSSYDQLARIMNMGETMEGGAITGKQQMEMIEEIFNTMDRGVAGIDSIIPKRGVAGIVAGGLVGAYALGATSGVQRFEGTEKFSDMRVKNSHVDRGLMKTMQHQHRDVPAGRSVGPDNFYERPINPQQTLVSSGMSTRLYGEAPTLSDAQDISRQMTFSGGRSSITINDNRRPIGYSYINKMIRD